MKRSENDEVEYERAVVQSIQEIMYIDALRHIRYMAAHDRN